MAVFSCLAVKNFKQLYVTKSMIGSFRSAYGSKVWNNMSIRNCHERTFVVKDSRFEYKKFKNLLHLYMMVGIIPLVALITYVNVFIGPATLALIPEGYEPKPWEYHRHPISRFFAKYLVNSPHEIHERNLHNIFIDYEKKELRHLKQKIMDLIAERQDYQAWYFDKTVVKYVRKMRKEIEGFHEKGIHNSWVK